jgi:hypothetical protein
MPLPVQGCPSEKRRKPDQANDCIVVVLFGQASEPQTARSKAGAKALMLLLSKPGDFWGYSPASENDGRSENSLEKIGVPALPGFRPNIPQTLGFLGAIKGPENCLDSN